MTCVLDLAEVHVSQDTECICDWIETLPCWCDGGPHVAAACPACSATCEYCERIEDEKQRECEAQNDAPEDLPF